ncbi:MAG: hypothetical protein ACOZNI_27180 [Myxococcota bacterium]
MPNTRHARIAPPPTPATPLPGEEQVEDLLLRRTTDEVNRLYRAHTLEAARQIGSYVLAAFFDGNPALFASRKRKHATWRAFVDSRELRVTRSFVWYAVRLVTSQDEFPPEIEQELALSHHRLLAHVHDPGTRLELAREAAENKLSAARLQERISARRPRAQGDLPRGRRPAPGIVRLGKALDHVDDLTRGLATGIGDLEKAQVLARIAQAETVLERVQAFLDELRESVEGPDTPAE